MVADANFWHHLPRPFLGLAPMNNVSDPVFRQLLIEHGRPDVFFCEFVSASRVIASDKQTALKLQFQPNEQPVVAQLWGSDPEIFLSAARLIKAKGFAGIDINMGCPKKQLTAKGGCAALINNPVLADEIIAACREGAAGLPVSVKTRIGWRQANPAWLALLLQSGIAALSIHYRLAKPAVGSLNHPDYPLWNMMKSRLPKALADGPADRGLAAEIESIRRSRHPDVRLIDNGGIFSACQLPLPDSEHDGYLIGRAAIENPFFFASYRGQPSFQQRSSREQLQFARQHLINHRQFYNVHGLDDTFPLMKKFMSCYLRNHRLLNTLLRAASYQQTEDLLNRDLNLETRNEENNLF